MQQRQELLLAYPWKAVTQQHVRFYFQGRIKSYPPTVTLPVHVLVLAEPLCAIQHMNTSRSNICDRKENFTNCLTAAWKAFVAVNLNSSFLDYLLHLVWPKYILVLKSK